MQIVIFLFSTVPWRFCSSAGMSGWNFSGEGGEMHVDHCQQPSRTCEPSDRCCIGLLTSAPYRHNGPLVIAHLCNRATFVLEAPALTTRLFWLHCCITSSGRPGQGSIRNLRLQPQYSFNVYFCHYFCYQFLRLGFALAVLFFMFDALGNSLFLGLGVVQWNSSSCSARCKTS
jgi:hypothetical protein